MALSSNQRFTRADIQEFFSRRQGVGKKPHPIRRVDFCAGKFYIRKRDGVGGLRLAVMVPKSVSKKSVIRNRLKRRTMEWFRKQYKGHPTADIIVSMDERAGRVMAKKLYQEFEVFVHSIH
ncbi:MAG: hypothetical protein A3I44_00880 [Candidatus Sungbacteria bacterium RIFCSPLOWO2_02_FULL_51_17]|uniref:Uncharacterized protein n=1 Tax=Candidatus Sungbacteria bacterium RIFCSPHIGHO2_02_FULL_51_29 TaxID=1802273 RepID=A0A1G2KX82_9BACT|nr:MAG: hypothetical protein A2676_05765 [Candidatus Sungbacteria bacterium RIFCSPHIGHO2_01_FULL_51_22]OHA03182.1 MAG: hypothetical protein A3C16_01835 [Candidatus Sungbacteria bacterium RIFCSPHIGHO2_02_FULL_51_29]OHA07883.1 MAG: hypothetical protein A3B29_01355 [Candidatus Sungbacteria bacterium RIFCSPLOWO2_01_FULL_51_34]OHA10675.1 MAG: hypothetical protein A3I44_00880 [Candidatus Sungbacteria bacterium RIFCSPLOWO2_02_FULL_51_17]